MTVRTLNYTRRQRLLREDLDFVVVTTNSGDHLFEAQIQLRDYNLPPESRVFVEAYRQTHWMRFSFGTVGHLVPPADRRLTEFETMDGVLFRVRVTASEETRGLLLAEGDQIPFRARAERAAKNISLLPVVPRNLGDEIFKVSYDDNRPVLLVNSTIGNFRNLAKDPVVVSLVYPQVLREILTRIALIEDEELDLDVQSDWRTQWCKFAERLPNVGAFPVERGDREDWINTAVESFCRRHDVIPKFNIHWKEGESA